MEGESGAKSDRVKMSLENTDRGRERERWCLISHSVAHPAAEAAFVTMTDPRCLHASPQQHHYSTLLMYTHMQRSESNTFSRHSHRCKGGNTRFSVFFLTNTTAPAALQAYLASALLKMLKKKQKTNNNWFAHNTSMPPCRDG